MGITMTFNIHDAKTRLSQLLIAVEQGEEVIIARNGNPVATLVPFVQKTPMRTLGCAEGTIAFMAADFDEPLTEFAEYMPDGK